MKHFYAFIACIFISQGAFCQWANLSANTTSWINCGDLDVTGTQLTVEALITMTGASAGEDIVSKHTGPGNVNYLLRPGGFEITTTTGYHNVGSSVGIAMNKTYHVAAVYDGTNIYYYVNGCETGRAAVTGNMITNNLLTAIGNQSNCSCEPFTGYIDEVRIWNVARTPAQLQANMNTLPSPGTQVGLMAYYNMNNTFVNQQGNTTYNGAAVGSVPYGTNPYDTTPLQTFNSIATSVNVDCSGSSDGGISVATVGGNTNYQYSLNGAGNQTSNYYNNLAAGNYTVTVTSADGNCVQQVPVTITQPPALTLTISSQTNVSCNGGNNGAVTLTASGGTSPATGTYSWTPNVSSTNTASGLTAGNYTVTLTDDVCHASGTELVTNGDFSSGNAGFSSGYAYTPPPNSAAAQYWVGTGPQTSTWNGGMFSNGDHTSGAGNYMLVNGAGTAGTSVWCQTIPVSTNTNYNFSAWVSSLNNSSPAILEFSINGTPIGSSFNAPASWGSWQQFATSWNSGGATSASICIVNLNTNPGGNDFGLDDISFQSCVKQCATTTVVTITEPASLTNTVSVSTPTICAGDNAVLTNTVSGGTSTYTVSWSGGGNTVGAITSNTVSPASTTTYTASVTDVNGCTSSATVQVVVNPLPTITANSATICAGQQTATLTANGASTYTWSPATGLSATNGASVSATPASGTTYTIAGTDLNGCVNTGTASVQVNSLPTVTVNSATICAGQQTATLTAGGASSYSWSPASGLSSTLGASVSANPASTSVYTVTGTDVNGCLSDASCTVTVNSLPVITLTNGVICNGSSVTLNAGGAISYSWAPSGSLSASTGNSVTAFPTSTTSYTVIGVDGNGCFNGDTTTVTVVNNPTVTVNSATICVGSSANLTAGGAITYSWAPATGLSASSGSSVSASPASTTVYTVVGTVGSCTAIATSTVTVNTLPVVTVNSATICTGSSAGLTGGGATSYSWAPNVGLSATSGSSITASPGSTMVYTVTGTDVNGCISTASSTVTVNNLPVVTVNSGLICAGGSLPLTANGANTYTWSPATGLSSSGGTSVLAGPASTTVYTVSGTDLNGCVSTAASTVTVANNPSVLVNSASICAGQQTANLTATGASSYSWSPATGLSSSSGSPVTANPASTTVYTVVGTIGTCTAAATSTVTVNSLPVVTASSTVICNGQSATLTAGGANTYTWSTMAQGSSITVSPSISAAYTVAGTDANGCINAAVASVTVNPLPNVTVNSAAVCVGTPTILTANGALVCTWNPATGLSTTLGNSVSANPASTTAYTVTGTDANSCSNTAVATVTVNPLPVVTASSATICTGNMASLLASGASSYNWNPSTGLNSSTISNPNASPNATTVYTVTGTDINNCKGTATLTVTVNPLPTISINPPTSSGCAPLCVNFSNTASSAPNYSYSWNLGNGTISPNQTPQACYSAAGSYTATVLVTDSNGCKNSSLSVIHVYPVPKANFAFTPSETTILDPQIQFFDLSAGATINSWSWYFGDGDSSHMQNPIYTYKDTGLYYIHLAVVSNYGCWDIHWDHIYIAPEFLLYVPNAFTPNEDNTNDIFLPMGEGITEYTLWVFDRWGELLFKTNDINKGWDGKKGGTVLEQDTYAWKIEARNIKGEPKHLSGVVNLLK